MKRDKNGKFIKSATLVERICEYCGTPFKIKESRLKYGGGKCCSRVCTDKNKKKTYKGKNNPMYGVTLSDEERHKKSKITKELWKSPDFRERVKKSQDIFFERAKTDGTWERANKKREETFLKKIGKKHNWIGTYGERTCDKTFIEKFGITSVEYRNKFNKTKKDTNIEKRVQKILFENEIDFIKHFILDGYEFDLFLPKMNILIECDGDYWHGKGLANSELNETQLTTRGNDSIKNQIAKDNNIILLRFWGSDIKKKDFDTMLLNKIWEKK